MAAGLPMFDGILWSFASAEIDVAGVSVFGVSGLGWKEDVKKEPTYGNGPLPIGRPRGQWSGSADMEILYSEYLTLISVLGDSFTDVSFNIGATYVEVNGPGIMPVQLLSVQIASPEVANTNDGKATVVKVGLSLIRPVETNGIAIMRSGLGGVTIGASFSLSF